VWPETSSKSLLNNSLNEIKTNEFVKTHLEQRQLIGFAVPIKSMGITIAAISVFLPEYRCNIDKEMAILAALKNASHCIEKQLVKIKSGF
jgi:DNA-binding IclR family transcriptional regulator